MNTASSAGSEDRVDDLSEVVTDTDRQDANKAALDNATDDKHDDAAGSSTEADAKGANEPEDTLEAVVRRAASKGSKGAEESPADGKGSEGEADATAADGSKPEDKDADVPFHKHPRWQEMLRERDTLKGQVDTFKEKAERFDNIGNFMREQNLTPQEMTQGFQIMALMKNDPLKALELLAPHITNLELAVGRKLPDDLQSDVDAGNLTPERAQELARTRMSADSERARREAAEREAQAERERQAADAAQNAAQAMQGAVVKWEEGIKQRDPDYSHKQRFVTDRVRALILEKGQPKSPEDAVKYVEEAYDDVNQTFRKVLPKRDAVRTVTSDQSSTRATPAPKTMEEAIRGALRK